METKIREQIVELIPRLRRFSYALTGNMHDADDLTQSGIERALGNLESWQEGTRLDSWLFRIINNLWIDQLRSRKSKGYAVDLEEAGELQGEDGRDVTESKLMLRQTRRAILQLPEEQRNVVTLVLIDGLSYQQAADILDVPTGTIMSRLARARKTLAEQLLPGGNS